MLFKLRKEDGTFQLLRACGAKIIYGTIIDAVLCEGILDCRSAFLIAEIIPLSKRSLVIVCALKKLISSMIFC